VKINMNIHNLRTVFLGRVNFKGRNINCKIATVRGAS